VMRRACCTAVPAAAMGDGAIADASCTAVAGTGPMGGVRNEPTMGSGREELLPRPGIATLKLPPGVAPPPLPAGIKPLMRRAASVAAVYSSWCSSTRPPHLAASLATSWKQQQQHHE
jgi:hypothetical protein